MCHPRAQAPIRAIFNRTVVGTLVLTFGLYLTFGTYEVVWSLYLVALGASVAWVSLTFVAFGIPEVILGPIAGRMVDRRGPVGIVIGSAIIIIFAGSMYALSSSYQLSTVVVPLEAAATAAMAPALFSMLAQGTPRGRSSTAQGFFGATSTLALVVASLAAGNLFEIGIGLPFWFFVVGLTLCTVVGLVIYRSGRARVVSQDLGVAAS